MSEELQLLAGVAYFLTGLLLGLVFGRKLEQIEPRGVYGEGHGPVVFFMAIAWPVVVPLYLGFIWEEEGGDDA